MRRTAATQAAAKGWAYARCGLPGKVLKAADWPAAPVAGDDVRVRLLCAPILAHDVQMIMGTYGGYKAEKYPAVAGTEGVGEVVEAGPASSVKKGAKVAFLKQNTGTWATEAVVQSGHVFDVSGLGIADDELALLSVYAAAVVMAAEYGDVKGQTCWVLGSDLALGAALTSALKAKKAKVVTVGEHSAGNDFTVDALASATQLPAPKFIFNGLGGKALRIATDNAAEEATVITYDNASREPMDVAGTRAVLNGLQMRSFWYKRWLETSSAAEKEAVFKEAAALAKSGPVKKKLFPFTDFAAAFDSVYGSPTVPVVSMAI
ncbi:putative trans-2-enoyl-CoA reductase [Diplonema papillatum]|nr:putative trans-2-enoyl-CoA reductase [Diplonema papillatum]